MEVWRGFAGRGDPLAAPLASQSLGCLCSVSLLVVAVLVIADQNDEVS